MSFEEAALPQTMTEAEIRVDERKRIAAFAFRDADEYGDSNIHEAITWLAERIARGEA
jgi:hypothetical protein